MPLHYKTLFYAVFSVLYPEADPEILEMAESQILERRGQNFSFECLFQCFS